MLEQLRAARRQARRQQEKRTWAQLAETIATRRQRTLKKLRRGYRELKVPKLGQKAQALLKKNHRSEWKMENLRLLLQRDWNKWNKSIDDFVADSSTANLHQIRIKAKTAKYAVQLSQRFYPDDQLADMSEWLSDLQDRIGAWHDELMLAQSALAAFSKPRAVRGPGMVQIIRQLKEKEITMGEAARVLIVSIRDTKEYRHMRRLLSAEVYAMTSNLSGDAAGAESITGPLQ
jgi:CHAD domain-containing protein